MYDTLLLQGLRRKMVEMLRNKGIKDERVLKSMGKVPRHLFLDISLERIAYDDRAIAIPCFQTISQPSTVAFQTELLELKEREKVLEIGTGSGYQTAVLYNISKRVYTIERMKPLYDNALQIFNKINIHPKCFFCDGYEGLQGFAPFDKILVTCASPRIPIKLIQQMKIGGMMVIPVGENSQKMFRVTRISETEIRKEEFGDFKFVPMLPSTQK